MTNAAKVKEIICRELGCSDDEVTDDASFVHDLGADSLDCVELAISLEEAFGIEIDSDDADRMVYVRDAVALVERRAATVRRVREVRP